MSDHPSVADHEDNDASYRDTRDHPPHSLGTTGGGDSSVANAEPWGLVSGASGIGAGDNVGPSTVAVGGRGPAKWADVGPEFLGRWLEMLAEHGDLVRPRGF